MEETINIAVVGNFQGNVFFLLFPKPYSFGRFGPFSEAKVRKRRFLKVGPFCGPFLGNVVENAKQKRVAPGNPLNFPQKKVLALIFGSLNAFF